jgi:hypothetical protein
MESKGIALEGGKRSASSPSRFTPMEFSDFGITFICTLPVAEKCISFKVFFKKVNKI